MRFLISSSLVLLVAGCGGAMGPQDKEKAAQIKAAQARIAEVQTTGTAEFGGNSFTVGRHPTEDFVLITAKAQSKVNAAFLESAAASATGCAANFDPGILAFVAGYNKQTPLPMSKGQFLRVDVKC